MPDHEIDYFALTQDAMRGVIRGVLRLVVQSGLPGDHHFYISFRTGVPGVMLSKRLRERYPSEMTIVLQHRFSNLAVHDDRFEVTLSFDSIPERLTIPFDALKAFFDPHARFAHQFEPVEMPRIGAELPAAEPTPAPEAPAAPTEPLRRPRPRSEDKKKKPAPAGPSPGPALKRIAEAKPLGPRSLEPKPAEAAPAAAKESEPAAKGKVVELDAFRKKPS